MAATPIFVLPIASGIYLRDRKRSGVFFQIRHFGFSKVHGMFTSFEARLDVGHPYAAFWSGVAAIAADGIGGVAGGVIPRPILTDRTIRAARRLQRVPVDTPSRVA